MKARRNNDSDSVCAGGNTRTKTKPLKLSERDFLRVIELLENPPAPNERLIAATRTHSLLNQY